MTVHNIYILLGSLLAGFVLAGCTTPKKMAAIPVQQFPEDYAYDVANLQTDSTENIATLPYQEFFQDEYLRNLIDSGLQRNNNMQIAIKQIELAQETMKQAKWGYLPTVSLSAGSASINRSSDNSMNGMMASHFMGKSYIEDYSTLLDISWEADIWGKIKNQKAGALATYLETQEATNAVRTNLIASIAQGYYNLLMLDRQKIVSEQNLALVDSTLVMTKVQNRLGMSNSLAVKQLENSKDNLLKSIRAISENITVQEYALSALAGELPKRDANRGSLIALNERDNFATGVPASLLERRPDIKRAEYAFRRSVSEVKIARANMYPALRISAQGGLNAFKASDWFSIPGSLFGMVSGSLTQPLLQGQQLKTAYNQAGIRSEQAELQFKESMLQAVTEVSTIIEQIASLRDQLAYTDQLVSRNQELIRQTNILFRNDMATYLEVLAAQQAKLQAELDQMQIKSQLLYAEVTLYKALGGGIK